MNIQTLSTEKPGETEQNIYIVLRCINCRALKTFQITNALKAFLQRKFKQISYESECMSCNNKFKSQLIWEK